MNSRMFCECDYIIGECNLSQEIAVFPKEMMNEDDYRLWDNGDVSIILLGCPNMEKYDVISEYPTFYLAHPKENLLQQQLQKAFLKMHSGEQQNEDLAIIAGGKVYVATVNPEEGITSLKKYEHVKSYFTDGFGRLWNDDDPEV